MNTTFVTCFFDLASFEGNKARRQPDVYFNRFLWIRDHPSIKKMIIFIEKKNQERLEALIDKDKHVIIPLEITDLPFFSHYSKMKKRDTRLTPSYYVVINSKVDLLLKVIELNPFLTDKFAWIDFGIHHVYVDHNITDNYEDNLISTENNKIHILMVDYLYNPNVEVHIGRQGHVAAGFFIGGKEEMRIFCTLIKGRRDYLALKGVYVMEESILPWIVENYNELFSIYHGDFYSIIRNINYPFETKYVIEQLDILWQLSEWKRCCKIGRYFWQGILTGNHNLTLVQYHHFLDYYYIALYYLPSHDEAREVRRRYMEEVEKNIEFKSIYLLYEDRINTNFGFLS